MDGQVIRMHAWSVENASDSWTTWKCRGCDRRIVTNDKSRLSPLKTDTMPSRLEIEAEGIPTTCLGGATPNAPVSLVTHLVVIAREGVPEVFEFSSYEEAKNFFEGASMNWTESYLTIVVAGPGRPLPMHRDPYCTPDIVALRRQKYASVCIEEDCDLSGGYAHVGPCEPCECPLQHAIDECPVHRAKPA